MDPTESVLEALISRGWQFRDAGEIRALIRTASSASAPILNSVESELLNLDLRSFGGKSLPDAATIKKLSHLQGPKILQVVSVRDIYRSSIEADFRDSPHHRLLRFVLTDGHKEVTALEFSPIPSVTEEMVVPGTKIRLENKITIHSGILCLNPKVVTIMGGIVQSLYEEWQMSQKYSGFSRSSLRLSQNDDDVGPPPFEKLQIQAHRPMSSSKFSSHMSGNMIPKQVGRNEGYQESARGTEKVMDESKPILSRSKGEDKPGTSEARPKEVSDAVPVQNQAAAQKLLQKMSQPAYQDRYARGQRQRSRGKEEETPVFTLEEWERRKGNLKPAGIGRTQDFSRDEELARQLQNQLDLEDFQQLQGNTEHTEAERIRMSMFSYGGAEESMNDGGREFRGEGEGEEGEEVEEEEEEGEGIGLVDFLFGKIVAVIFFCCQDAFVAGVTMAELQGLPFHWLQ